MNKKNFYLFLVTVIGMMVLPTFTLAADNSTNNGPVFSVSPIYPSHQDKEVGEQGYFKLTVSPGTKEVLEIEVVNLSEENIQVSVSRNRGTTTDTGLINYQGTKKKDSPLIQLPELLDFNQMVEERETIVELKGKESKKVATSIQIPNQPFSGDILGGIHVKETNPKAKKSDKMVINTFSYSIPVILNSSKELVKNELTLHKVSPILRNYHPYIEAELINSQPAIIRDMKINGEIREKKTDEIRYKMNLSDLQMAPHSQFNLGFDLKDTPIEAGEYFLRLEIKADGQPYHFEKTFEITKQAAREKNTSAVYTQTNKDKLNLPLILVIVALLVAGIFIGVIFLERKKKQERKRKKKRKKRK